MRSRVTGRAVFPVALESYRSHQRALVAFKANRVSPDEKSVRELDELLVLVLRDDDLVFDLLDHSLSADVNLVLLEGVVGVLTAREGRSARPRKGKHERTRT